MSPENANAKRIAIENLRPGMLLARDLLDRAGNILLSKDTTLSKENYNMVMLSATPYVFVFENSINLNNPSFFNNTKKNIVPSDVPIKERESFINFKAEYEKKPLELELEFNNIIQTGKIEEDKLYTITENVMNTLKSKNDVFTYLSAIKSKDEATFVHSVNVSLLANLFGIWLNVSKEELYNITNAALLHDIGKTQISEELLTKKDRLSRAEYDEIKKHTILGYRILESSNLPEEVKRTALSHHEKADGSGYPLGIRGDKIGRYTKIISICDIYETMTSNRTNHAKICPFDVIKSFEQRSYGLLDTEMLLIFLQNIAYTYLNSRVKLSNGEEGEIVFINRNDLSNPIVKTSSDIIDLRASKNIHIVSLL